MCSIRSNIRDVTDVLISEYRESVKHVHNY